MSIASKIESISNHLENAYNSLENIGVDLENVNKNIDNLSAQIESVYNDLPKVTDEDTEIILTPTKKGKMELTLKGGNTNQFTTTGKNLFKNIGISQTKDGITYTQNNDGTFNLTGTSTDVVEFSVYNPIDSSKLIIGNTYTLSSNISCGDNTFKIYLHSTKESNLWVKTQLALTSGTSLTDVISEAATAINYKYVIRVGNGVSLNLENIQVQLEGGSSATSFEPYTGGIKSPNPNYPQNIQIVTGENEIKINNNLLENVTPYATGKTVSNTGALSDNSNYNVYKVFLTPNTEYTISEINNLASGETAIRGVLMTSNDTSIEVAFYRNRTKMQKYTNTFTTTADTSYILMQFRKTDTEIKMEYGDSATQYWNQTYPISLGVLELCKIDTYQDYIYEENGNWYKYEKIKKKLFNGTLEDGVWSKETNYYNCNSTLGGISGQAYTNYYTYGNLGTLNNFMITTNTFRVNDGAETLENYKTWLSSHNIVLYYPLSTATTVLITDQNLIAQLNALKQAMSYNGQTNIFQTNSNLPFIIKASALKKND